MSKTIGQLVGDRHAILLENALIDTASPLNFSIPTHLQSQSDPGAYIVQARGPINAAFRAMLARSGAEIVSFIPNDAYLVRAPAGVANGLAGDPLTQAVIPFEPYYKISSSMPVTVGQKTFSSAPTKTTRAAGPSLLALAMKQAPLPAGTCLTLGLFKDSAAATVAQIEKLGGQIVARDNSPFGPVVRVEPPKDWVALATLPGVQIVEPYHQRMHANDLSRVTVGVAADPQVSSNYMGLTGLNVMVEVNDSGIDANHPDLTTLRVFGDSALGLVDTNGHGTHVAGTIAGNGSKSSTVTNASGSIMPGTNGQFRGMAPLANLYSVAAINDAFNALNVNVSDQYMQEAPALTNALISNNSWNYDGDNAYDLAAASYDAAVRDALPEVTGSQPVLFVFSAGNVGDGDNDGGGGNADTILSPATAKNVITVGALEQLRYITNIVTDLNSNQSAVWQPETDTSYEVAGYSSRGNVGVGTEGTYGRFKPDIVAPGSFVISTRSEQWNTNAYYNPTNDHISAFFDFVQPDSLSVAPFSFFVWSNAVQVIFTVEPNSASPSPFPTNLPIYVWEGTDPQTTSPVLVGINSVTVPASPLGVEWTCAVSNTTDQAIDYDLVVDVQTTNDLGNYYQVLEGMNDSLGGWYRYESGTSMSAADVSGVLALMQDYFTNVIQAPRPSPALLKAMVINGARVTDSYDFQVQNTINAEGWGLINLPDSLPPGITNQLTAACDSFFIDQSPATALATGDSHTYMVTVDTNTDAQYLPLQVTLTWTDPPGNPVAAIKLVNSLELVVTNFDDPANPVIFYGNDIAGGNIYNTPEGTNAPDLDSINNVQNVFISPLLGTQYSITVIGRSVNVNAVTAQTNNAAGVYAPNVVQDYALVISCGEGEVTNAFTVTDSGIVSNPTTDQQITYVVTTNAPLMNQLAGASTPLLGTNTIQLTTNGTELNGIQLGGTNILTLGMTNQWHFYVVTNTGAGADFTNAAFITFIPDTLSIPRMGVFANSQANATRPEADIDLYVSTDPTLMNLNPLAISSADKSVGRGGTEFVYYTNSVSVAKSPGSPSVYYVGVYSEDQEAAQYGFMPIFTDIPFSQMNSNGDQIVNGQLLPVNIPDGSPAHPGSAYIFALATYPMEIQRVVVTNAIAHQNFGDLIGGLSHGQQNGLSQTVVLNNHDSLGNTFGPPPRQFIYDDSGFGDIIGSRPSDGPGSLNGYVGQQAIGPWILTEVDDSLTQTGAVTGFNLLIQPHQNLGKGLTGTVGPMGWWYGYIDVPSGTASLTILAANISSAPSLTPPLELYVNVGSIPTLTGTNSFGPVGLTNPPVPPPKPGNSITINSPAPGRYWVGLYNGNVVQQNFYIIANLGTVTPPAQVIFSSAGPVPILDDAVTTNSIFVSADQTISSVDVALRVDHPRVSDLVFHLISPDGTRVLLVENRGGTTTNGMGATLAITNITPATSSGNGSPSTNVINTGQTAGTAQISYNFYSVPDELVVQYHGTNIFDSGIISGSGVFNVAYGPGTNTQLTIIMNPTINPGPGDLWDYTVNSAQVSYSYLVLTEDTNKTTTPIKFAPTPFASITSTNGLQINGSFEEPSVIFGVTTYGAGATFGGWTVISNSIDLVAGGVWVAANGSALVDLNGFAPAPGAIYRNVTNTAGKSYQLRFAYAGNPDAVPVVKTMQVFWGGSLVANVSFDTTGHTESNLGWVYTNIIVTGTGLDRLQFSSTVASSSFGPLVDNISLTQLPGELYYLPEESLDLLQGENAQGQWQLEIQDDRAGDVGTNVSWQLRFNFPTANGSIGTLTGGVPQTNSIPAGGIAYYLVNVPANADIATNILISPNGPLNLWFNPTTLPSGTNSPGDVLLLGGTTGGTAMLHTNGAPPNLVPGGSYYLAVQNTNTFAVTNYSIEVDFHFIPVPIVLTNGLPQTNSISGGGIDYYLVNVPTNADWATNLLLFAGGPLNVWFNPTNLPAATNPPDILLFSGATNGISIFGTNSIPTNIVPGGTYYLAVQNTGTSNVTYGIAVNFHLQAPSVPAGGVAYYLINVPTNADFATNILLFATGPLNIWFTTNSPPSITNANDVHMLPDATYPSGTNGSFVLSAGTTPPLVPGGTYYLGVQNTNSVGVFYGIEVDFHLLSTTNVNVTNTIFITSITHTNIGGTNGFLLQWQGPTNFQYEIQWTASLAPVVWNTIVNPVINVVVTSTNGHYSFFDDGTLTGGLGPVRFYQVLGGLNLGPIIGSGSATNTVLAGAMSQAVVTVPTNATSANNLLISATGPLNVWFNQTNPPTGNTSAGDRLMLSAVSAGSFVLTSSSVPPLVPGANYYLGFQNPGASNVTFVFQVTFGFTPPIAVSNFSVTATNGGIWLKWNGLTNYQYQVQWTTNLAPPPAWNTISNIVLTSTTGIFTFFDDGSLTGGLGRMKFYRLIAWPFMTPIPQTLFISSVTLTNLAGTNDLMLKWSAPTNYQYGIQWTTNLAVPYSNWFIITNPPPTLANGVYTFIDNGLTGPPGSAKFFRIFDY
jgi:choice-of-anchor C domain-containing protein